MKLNLSLILIITLSFIIQGCLITDLETYNFTTNDPSYSTFINDVYKPITLSNDTLYHINSGVYSLQNGATQILKYNLSTHTSSVVAGSKTQNVLDGIGPSAQFNTISDLVVKSGTPDILYVADLCSIRKVDISTLSVTTIAGSSTNCMDTDGTGTSATFTSVNALYLNGDNLYIGTNERIKLMNLTTRVVTTLAGGATTGYTDAVGTSALFGHIAGITQIGTNLYIVDSTNIKIRKLDLNTYAVSTLAGSTTGYLDGTGTSAQFNSPHKITSDGIKYLFIADQGNFAIRKIDVSNSSVTTVLRGSSLRNQDADGNLTDSKTSYPSGIAFSPYGLFFSNQFGVRRLK